MKGRKQLNILIVEDHPAEMVYCCELVREICPAAAILKAVSSSEALMLLAEHPVDLALLDVALPDMTGFQLASRIRDISQYAMLSIVFVTADATSELEAFRRFHCYHLRRSGAPDVLARRGRSERLQRAPETSGARYIIKPFTRESFRSTIQPLISALLTDHAPAAAPRERLLFLDAGASTHMLPPSDILFVESQRHNLFVHTVSGPIKLHDHALSTFLRYVDDPSFLQCHRAFAVNTSRVNSIQKESRRSWILTFSGSNDICPVSNTYYPAVRAALEERMG